MRMMNDILHYGIPRRSGRYPWGSGDRPYQSLKDALKGKRRSSYFQSERTLPKGTKMYRTFSDKSGEIKEGTSTYVTYTDVDRDLYKGGYIRKRDNALRSYEYEFELKEELKLPSRETYMKTIEEVLSNDPKLLKESVDSVMNYMIPENSWDRMEMTWNEELHAPDPKKWDQVLNEALEEVKDRPVTETFTMISYSLAGAENLKGAIIKNLKEKGFNGMVDEASVGGFGKGLLGVEGVDPLIIFDSSILKTNKVNKISNKEEIKSNKQYQTWKRTARQSKEW